VKRQLPLLLVFISGVFMVIQYFVPAGISEKAYEFLIDWTIIIGIFALALGIWSLVRVSYHKIRTGHPDAKYSILTLAGLALMLFFGFQLPGYNYKEVFRASQARNYITENFANTRAAATQKVFLAEDDTSSIDVATLQTDLREAADSVEHWVRLFQTSDWFEGADQETQNLAAVTSAANEFRSLADRYSGVSRGDTTRLSELGALVTAASESGAAAAGQLDAITDVYPFTGGLESYMFRAFFEHIMIPIQATMFSLLAFYIASAAYRAFRARSFLSTVLLIAAFIVMARVLEMGPLTDLVNDLSAWVLLVPNLAAKRAIWIGVGLGIVATSLKVILGIERSYLGRD
jgi:hypothetical protein